MSIPVQTQILDIIGARMALISVSNGYFSTLGKIERARLKPFKNGDMPAINYYYTGDILVKTIHNGVTERGMSVIIEYYDTTRDEVFTDLADKLSTDIQIALERDVLAPLVSDPVSSSLGGKVARVEVESITPAMGAGQAPYCGTVVILNVFYKVAKHDPLTLIT